MARRGGSDGQSSGSFCFFCLSLIYELVSLNAIPIGRVPGVWFKAANVLDYEDAIGCTAGDNEYVVRVILMAPVEENILYEIASPQTRLMVPDNRGKNLNSPISGHSNLQLLHSTSEGSGLTKVVDAQSATYEQHCGEHAYQQEHNCLFHCTCPLLPHAQVPPGVGGGYRAFAERTPVVSVQIADASGRAPGQRATVRTRVYERH